MSGPVFLTSRAIIEQIRRVTFLHGELYWLPGRLLILKTPLAKQAVSALPGILAELLLLYGRYC